VTATETAGDAVVAAPIPGESVPAAADRRLTFRPPRLRDPRLHVASVVVTVQVLGQVAIRWDLSIAQILVSLLTAAAIELTITVPRTRVVAWPASALLTGNGIALILRVPGTEHGDWWSLKGWYVFAAAAALGVLSKYVIRVADRPLFNPSNLALVVTFLVLGSGLADPQDLWWGPMSLGLVLTYGVILVGGLVITRRLGLLAVSVTFWVLFAGLMAVVAATGHSMTARWSLGPVAGMDYWTTLVFSPEVLIFVFFMITDPKTAARGRTAGMLYAAGVAGASAVLISMQTTEYATKVALLAGLVLVCAGRPLLERLAPAGEGERPRGWLAQRPARPAALAVAGVAVVALVGTAASVAEPPVAVAAAGTTLPPVELSAAQRPEVEIGDALVELGGSFDRDMAESIVTETLGDVLLADRAVAAGDPELLDAVASGPWRAELGERPATAAPERTFERAVVDVVRDPEEFQAQPRLAITVTGRTAGVTDVTTYHVLATSEDARIERAVPVG
jgi:hypothetical protein